MLQSAQHLYRFQTDVTALNSWMNKIFNKLTSQVEARNVKEAKLMLELHEEIQSELRVREEVFARVQEYGDMLVTDGGLPADEVGPKLQQLALEKKKLEETWTKRRDKLKDSYELQVNLNFNYPNNFCNLFSGMPKYRLFEDDQFRPLVTKNRQNYSRYIAKVQSLTKNERILQRILAVEINFVLTNCD